MESVLVTGGAGFIGSHIVDQLVGKGYNIVVLDDLSGGFKENVNPKATFVEGSILDLALLKALFNEHQFTYVFHLAAYAAENLSHFIRHFNYENNVIGSINLINEAVLHNVKCFVFTSSIAAYGDISSPMKEEDVQKPCDPYGIAKMTVECDLKAAHKVFGLNYIIFKPHNVYGERQNMEDKYRNVVTIFMNQLAQGKPVTVFGDGMQTRCFSYVGDVASAIAGSVNVKGAYNQAFNIGADEYYTVKQLAEILAKKMNVPLKIQFLNERKEVKHAHADHTKIKSVLNYSPNIPLEVGLERTIKWGKEVGIRKTKVFKNIEITKNLPDGWA